MDKIMLITLISALLSVVSILSGLILNAVLTRKLKIKEKRKLISRNDS